METTMTESDFEAALHRDGYEPRRSSLAPNHVNPDHAHGFTARLLILEGEITIRRGGQSQTFRSGESCEVPAGEVHSEHVGAEGVRYLVGRRAA